MDDIKQVKQKYTEQLMKLPGVNSVGIGLDVDGNPSIVVGIDSQQGGGKSQIPSILDGYPVTVKESGPIKAQ